MRVTGISIGAGYAISRFFEKIINFCSLVRFKVLNDKGISYSCDATDKGVEKHSSGSFHNSKQLMGW